MKVLNLRCSHDHRFEGWFASEDDFVSQGERGLLACPICNDATVSRLPSAPRLNVSRPRDDDPAARVLQARVQGQWLRAARELLQKTEDVGDRFPEEARRIHYGEAQERGIRGRASFEEATALREEGIDVVVLPLPDSVKEPMQ
jgi:hypothetical protein